MLRRKSAKGSRFVSEKDKVDVVINFYEDDDVSDLLKGHNNVYKESVVSEEGVKSVFNRAKRVLKISSCDMLEAAQSKIGFRFSLRTLLYLRPPWVLLPREAHSLTCLCDRCQNIKHCLRAVYKKVNHVKQYGATKDKAVVLGFDITTSVSGFVSKVLHPKPEGNEWHSPECYYQTCDSTEESLCGRDKLDSLFEPLLKRFGDEELQLTQHERVQYVKPDSTLGYKFDQVQSQRTLTNIVDLLKERMFGTTIHKQPFIMHRLKMLLASKMRQEVPQNISDADVIIYSDFSKELEITGQEQCKSELYGASNQTIQLVGQVFQMTVLPPGPPLNLEFDCTSQRLSFNKPGQDGGSRIQGYEIHIRLLGTWYHLSKVEVKYLSSDPNIPVNLFGRLGGNYLIRVYSRNLSGLGESAETIVQISGDLPFCPKLENELPQDHFVRKNMTWLAEYFFFSDHGDSPKTWKTITKCKQMGLADLQTRFSRQFTRCITVTDTGGENYGSSVSIDNICLTLIIPTNQSIQQYTCRIS